MEMQELGRTGEQVSRLALGAMIMGTTTDEPTSFAMLDRFIDAGGTFVDTANCYAWWLVPDSYGGHSESLLGRWMASRANRDQVFLATKGSAQVADITGVWNDSDEADFPLAFSRFEGAGAGVLERAIDDSLRRLQTDHVDLYYVHVDDHATPLEETLEALAGIVEAGKARHIGWSNVRTWRLERIRQLCERHGWPAPVAVQQQHSYLRPHPGSDNLNIAGREQLDYLGTHDDVTLVAYSSILKGIYDRPETWDEHHVLTDYAGADTHARLTALTEVAAEVGARPSQVVLAWLLAQRSPATIPLVGPRTPEQLESSLAALELKLSDDLLDRLDAAGA